MVAPRDNFTVPHG